MPKKPKIEEKKSKRLLRVNLSEQELLEAGKLQADKSIELHALEDDKKRINDDFKAKISALEADLGSLANKISTGYEHRMVSCTEKIGIPEPDKKTIVRDDTGAVVCVEDLADHEMQRELLEEGETA